VSADDLTTQGPRADKQQQILDGVLTLLARSGISGVSMRAVAREAGVALGLVSYYYDGKTALIAAALARIGDQDAALLVDRPALAPDERLRQTLRKVVSAEMLTPDYLALRLQLWALPQTDADLAAVNAAAHLRYRDGLAALISAARPDLPKAEATRRATDIAVVQNGIWLTSLLGVDKAAVRRSIALCERIALE
jgi:AcrR family transcriptional regulator